MSRTLQRTPPSNRFVITVGLIMTVVVVACNNTGTGSNSGSGGSSNGLTKTTGGSGTTGPSGVKSKAKASFSLVSAAVTTGASGASGASGGSGGEIFTLIFNASNTVNTLSDVCQVQSGSGGGGGSTGSSGGAQDPTKSCKCSYTWAEQNLSDTQVITRTNQTAPTQITAFQVQCPAPDVFDTEIPDGTVIKITLIPDSGAGNNSGFTVNTLNFTKQPITSTGDFRDAEGHAFRNIFHYSCFDKFQKNLILKHTQKVARTDPATNTSVMATVANSFTADASAAPNSFSAQSYYFDFYVRSNEAGSINAGNQSFTCPQVNVNGNPSFYPMDSTFAVSLQSTKDFNIPVQGLTFIATSGNDPGNILGFAAKPNADGSCPSFADSTGKVRRTFRLRKVSAIYPLRYDFDGDVKDQSQPRNTLFILDRPVDKLGTDPLKPITRLGPKPCPFSFKTAQFGQKCSTDASLSGWNIDGTQINGDPTCPVYPPPPAKYVKQDGTLVIRPFKPFLAHFMEDTSFKACAFQSNIQIDPEIVLSHDDNVFPGQAGPHDFYCAKHYAPAGAIIPPPAGDPFDKPPGDCDLGAEGAAIKTDKTYACLRTFDPTNSAVLTPTAGCCQVCSGPDCTAVGGGTRGQGRNAAFSPPQDIGNPPQAMKLLPRATPNQAGGGGCFDPFED